jgi:hypothetical protein
MEVAGRDGGLPVSRATAELFPAPPACLRQDGVTYAPVTAPTSDARSRQWLTPNTTPPEHERKPVPIATAGLAVARDPGRPRNRPHR